MKEPAAKRARVARQTAFDSNGSTFLDQTENRSDLEGFLLDRDPNLLQDSYRLRYRVYCVERGFLYPAHHPKGLERDEFDRFSLHIGVLNEDRELVATSRLVMISMAGLPLFRHCAINAHEHELYRETNRVAEISRLCISREFRGRHSGSSRLALSLYRATYQASKRSGLTHWVAAMEPALCRLLTGLGVPFRSIGPLTDYFGPVAPYLVDLSEFDRIILSGTRPRLASFVDGLEPEFHPGAAPAGFA
jgi:N-acyl-L-homoserine lactone synthetase